MDVRPGKIVLIHGIDDNIIITNPFYLGVYQDEAKNKSSKKWFFGVGTKYKKMTKRWWMFLRQHWNFFKSTHFVFEMVLGVVANNNNIKYWWRNVHRKMGASFICFVNFPSTLVYSVVHNQSFNSYKIANTF